MANKPDNVRLTSFGINLTNGVAQFGPCLIDRTDLEKLINDENQKTFIQVYSLRKKQYQYVNQKQIVEFVVENEQ